MIAMSKSKLLESIENGYRLFKELLADMDRRQMNEPGAVGKWSVKDTVAHIAVHEQRMVQWMEERLCGEQPGTPQPYDMPEDELNGLNEQIYQENLNRTLDDVLCDLDKTHAESLRLVEESKEEDILNPNRFQLQGGEPLWEAIAANTFWHYEEHGQDIKPHRS
jgi:hypothetical protein